MTHYSVLVIVPKGTKDIDGYVSDVLAPYDENVEVAPYVETTVEKEKERLEKHIAEYEAILAENDGEKWNIEKVKEKLEELRATTPEKEYEKKCSWSELKNDEGEPLSTYNPASKWDWYQDGWCGLKVGEKFVNRARVGEVDFAGAEAGWLADAEKNLAKLKKEHGDDWKGKAALFSYFDDERAFLIDGSRFSTFAVVTKDGVWHEAARMGWWAVTYDRKEDETTWTEKFRERYVDGLDVDDMLVILDCHI